MTIEMAPKAPAAMSAKAAESSSGKQSADDSAGATRTGAGSFLFALASVELGEQVPVGEGLPPELVAEGALPVDEEFLFEAKFDASAALVNPAFLLTQVQVAPTPEVVVPARAGVNAAGRGQDGRQSTGDQSAATIVGFRHGVFGIPLQVYRLTLLP